MGSERGQATVEWTGLVLLLAVALGALMTLAPSVDGRSLGGSLAHTITCAARGGCAAPRRAPAAPRHAAPAPGRAPPLPGRALPPAGPTRPKARPTVPPSKAGEAPGSLRGVRTAAKRLWLICLGYRRFRYDLYHPRGPTESLPLGEALDMANECLNPLGFLLED